MFGPYMETNMACFGVGSNVSHLRTVFAARCGFPVVARLPLAATSALSFASPFARFFPTIALLTNAFFAARATLPGAAFGGAACSAACSASSSPHSDTLPGAAFGRAACGATSSASASPHSELEMLTQVSTGASWRKWTLDSGKGAISPTLRILVRIPRRTRWWFMGPCMGPAESRLEVGNCTSAILGGSGSCGIPESTSSKGPKANSSDALARMAPKTLAMAAHSVGVAFATMGGGTLRATPQLQRFQNSRLCTCP